MNASRLCQSYCFPWVLFHPEAAPSLTSLTVLCLGCQGLPCLQWMLSLGIAQLGCADTSRETNASSYIQGYTERENESTDKTTFCLLIFHCVPFSRKKAFLSFFQGSDVSKIQCPENWSKSFALCCMAALERKRLQPEKRDWDTVELVVVVGHPSMTAKARWVTKAKVELTAYSIYCFWQIIINIGGKYIGDFGVCVYMCSAGSMCSPICKIFFPLRPQVLEATFLEHVGGLSQGCSFPPQRGCLSVERTLFTFQPWHVLTYFGGEKQHL